MFAFRYYCALGYGESWFVDITVYGGNASAEEIRVGLSFIGMFLWMESGGTADVEEFSVENLENGVEYCLRLQQSMVKLICSICCSILANGPFPGESFIYRF